MRPSRSRSLPLRLALGVLAAVLLPSSGRTATCDTAAFALRASSYMDAQLNPPTGEDLDFFTRTDSTPAIYFLLDNSSSMLRLPPNGPGFMDGLPPLNDINCPGRDDDPFDNRSCSGNTPSSPKKLADSRPGVMGCGLDAVSRQYAGGGTAIGAILSRTFAPTCGKSTTPAAYLNGYSSSYDYADEAKACPSYVSSTVSKGSIPGYDSDFYCGSSTLNGTTISGAKTTCPAGAAGPLRANFFDKNLVYHENISDGANYPGGWVPPAGRNPGSGVNWGFNGTEGGTFNPAIAPGNGWKADIVFPYRKSSTEYGSIDDFCTRYQDDVAVVARNFTQDRQTVSEICSACLKNRGFFFDGYAYRENQENVTGVLYASIWLTGNFLNFFPPKHVVARKAMKDILWDNSSLRSGIAVFGSGAKNCGDGANQIVPLSPECGATEDASRWKYRAAINTVAFGRGTPLGEALLNVGQRFRKPGTDWFNNNTNGKSCKNDAFEAPGSDPADQGFCYPCQSVNVVIVTDGRPKPSDDPNDAFPKGTATAAQAASACTSSSSSQSGCIGNAATGVVKGPDETACPQCNPDPSVSTSLARGTSPFGPGSTDSFTKQKEDKSYLNNAIKVAWLFHNFDFRQESEALNACTAAENTGKQSLNIYTLGFGTSFNSEATQLLGAMANVGGGLFVNANNPAELTSAFDQILRAIDGRSTAFGTASSSPLQANAGQSVLVPRFNPSSSAFWGGHLYRFEVFSEFAAGCTPGGAGDLDCDCACGSVFLKDAEHHFISEDAQGRFMKNVPNLPTCSPSNRCGGSCGVASTDPARKAVPFWDAEKVLEARSWRKRAVYTVVDKASARDGVLDAKDPVLPLIDFTNEKFDADTLSALLPYMGLTLTSQGNCDMLAGRMSAAGDGVGAAAVRRDLTLCAEAVLAYVLGADLLNQNLNSASTSCKFPPASSGTDANGNALWNPLALCDRTPPNAPGKLGDIFHSSPVRVLEPEPSSNLFSSYSNQTLPSLWLTDTQNAHLTGSTNGYAYDDYADAYSRRRRLVVVGANDGLLHAFDAGNWKANLDDPELLPTIRTSAAPFHGYYDRGTGDEVWAFLPPDLLAKVPLLVGAQHHLFVDADPMVRDVWVDGSEANAALGGAPEADDVKQAKEFHTVVIGAERRGGTHYFALDVTDATKKQDESGFAPPRFLWIFPQPSDAAELEMGETYTSFLPSAPPIVPVRLDASTFDPTPGTNTRRYTDSSGETVQVHERWLAFLSGGYDPQLLRGRGVHAVDVWTGKELLGFSRPGDSNCAGSTRPECKLDAPVAGQVSAIAFGKGARADAAYPANGGFFDTATFGDTNGALWVLRFNDPGKVKDGKVSNWFGGRVFQLARSSSSDLCGPDALAGANPIARQPFFYMPANVPLYSSTRQLRVLAGTGDRFNLLDPYGGTCGPDNLRACLLRGCSVSVTQGSNKISVDSLLGTQSGGLTASACSSFGASLSPGAAAGTAGACNGISGRVQVEIRDCPWLDSGTASTKSFSVDCGLEPTGAVCSPTAGATPSTGRPLPRSTALTQPNWFVSARVFDDSGDRLPFASLEAAEKYDAARLSEADLTQIDGATANPSTASLATAASAGWAISYNHAPTFRDPATSKVFSVAKADERTATPSTTPGDSCIYWSTVQPALPSSNATCPCTVQNERIGYLYGASVASGGACLSTRSVTGSGTACTATATRTRSIGSATIAVPSAPQTTYFINASGQVSTGLTSFATGAGASNIPVGQVVDAVRPIEWLPVSRGIEACRHASTAPSDAVCR